MVHSFFFIYSLIFNHEALWTSINENENGSLRGSRFFVFPDV
jgi:hypothetical protein